MAGSDFTGKSGGGFLARVAKLVKTGSDKATNWGDLDQRVAAASTLGGDQQDVAYSKAALKDMMERKRHNDFVRKREFEMLRKLRRRARGLEGETSLRPSFFVSSMNYTRPPNEREQTLKKINDIEEQMSQQWWQGKPGAHSAAPTTGAGAADSGPNQFEDAPPASPSYAPTEPVGLGMKLDLPNRADEDESSVRELQGKTHSSPLEIRSSQESVSLNIATGAAPIASALASAAAAAPNAAALGPMGAPISSLSHSDFSPSREFSMEIAEVVHDPEMEEAAILFANDEDDAAEAALVACISAMGPRQTHEPSWLTLFDFYRAVGNHEKFEELSLNFVTRFHRSAPQWFSMPEMLGLNDKKRSAAAAEKPYDWRCPGVLSVQSLTTMQVVLSKLPQPWRLDWATLKKIEDPAIAALQAIASDWVGQPLALHFSGVANLQKVLAEGTQDVDKDSPQERWQLRLLMTRLMQRDEDFESLALDFCIAFEVSPPAWERTKNTFKSLDEEEADDDVHIGHTVFDSMLMEDAPAATVPGTLMMAGVELAGQIHGDATALLATLNERRQGQSVLVLDCSKLMRIDFTAAGNLLNWVIEQKHHGIKVQFSQTHRLVGALFDALGLSEQARVVLRTN
jgi:ABC-type transporter Mla MlaB component